MSEQEMTSLEARTEDEAAPPAESIDRLAAASRRSSRLAMVLSLATLVIVAGSLFFAYRYWSGMQQSLLVLNQALDRADRDQTELRQRLTETHQAMQQQQQQIAQQEQTLQEQRQALEQERDSLRRQGAQINRSMAAMQQRIGVGNTRQWQVAEAEYLMRVANHRLSLMHDPHTALEALSAADERLQDTGDPGWSEVRGLLAREIATLSAVPEVDKDGLSASLAALEDQVEQLPLRASEGTPLAAAHTEPSETEERTEKSFDLGRIWDDLWSGFKSMVVIRHYQEPVEAMLSPEQGYFLRQNLRLKLESATIALLGRNAGFYRESLQSAADWVNSYFAPDVPQVEAFAGQLAHLALQEIAPELPDISASLRALQDHREALNQEEAGE